jgi:hypothetical protein
MKAIAGVSGVRRVGEGVGERWLDAEGEEGVRRGGGACAEL